MTKLIALVEDDELLRKNYADALRRDGYNVVTYCSRQEASDAFNSSLPDMAILDIMLDDDSEGGFEICRQLRYKSTTIPIIFLTARTNDVDRVSGLRLGAWDYLTKDTTTLDFLPARVSSLFNVIDSFKIPTNKAVERKVGSLMLDEERKQVFWKDVSISLSLTEFWLLLCLTKHPGHVKSHQQLMHSANVVVTDNAITAHIRRIRDKFKSIDPEFSSIKSEYGMGYRWVNE